MSTTPPWTPRPETDDERRARVQRDLHHDLQSDAARADLIERWERRRALRSAT